MIDETLERIRVHETMAILIARMPDDWNMARERTYARQLRSRAVWIALASYAPLANLARPTEAAEAGNEPKGGFEEFNGERRDQWLRDYFRDRQVIPEPPAYRQFWTRFFVE